MRLPHGAAPARHLTRRRWTVTARLAVAVVTLACASAPSGASTAPRTSRDVILADEIVTSGARTAMEAIERLRPHMLQSRGVRETQAIAIYIDGNRTDNSRGNLTQIPASQVKEIRYLNGQDATQRFGANHGAGAILVTRKS